MLIFRFKNFKNLNLKKVLKMALINGYHIVTYPTSRKHLKCF